MAVNPLFVFVGLSVTTVGGIVAVVHQSKSPPKPVPAMVQPAPIAKIQPQSKPVTTPLTTPAPPSPLAKKPIVKSAAQKLASLEPEPKIAHKAPAAAKVTKPVAKPAIVPVPVAPTFDMVRVEKDGGAVVVGKAEPQAKLVLKLNNKIIGKTTANEKGDWVFVPEQLVPQGSNELIVEATGDSKQTVRSKQSIFIAMPKEAKEKPLIVVTKPDAPTRVLQKPESKPKTVKVAAPKPLPAPIVKAPIAKGPAAKKLVMKVVKKQPKPVLPKVEPKKLVTPRVKPVIRQPVKKLASLPKPVEAPKPAIKVVVPKPVSKKTKTIVQPKPVKAPRRVRLAFGTVDYNDSGEIVFTGKAIAGSIVRLYVDNVFVGDAVAKTNDGWVFHGKKKIKPGVHQLRADQIGTGGKVAQRIGVPFVRANPKKVATLLKTRKKPEPKVVQPEKPKTAIVKTPVVKTPVKVALKAPEKAIVKPVVLEPVPEPAVPNKVAKVKVVSQPTAPIAAPEPPKQKQVAAPVPAKPDVVSVASAPVASAPVAVPVVSAEPTPPKPKMVSHVIIQPGNNLWNISRVIYGKGVAYTTIYQANQDQIKDPDQIYPGQIFTTPGTTSTGSIGPDEREPLQQSGADKTAQN